MRRELFLWLLGVVLVVAVGYGYAQQRDIHMRYVEFRRNEEQLEAVRTEIEALKTRVEEAKSRIERLETDPVEIEAAIRRIRRLTRDGEIVFRIEEEDSFWRDGPAPDSRIAPITVDEQPFSPESEARQ